MARPELCVSGVVVHSGRLLLVRRSPEGPWAVPGGRVEVGETLKEAVTRELAEETGLAVECGPLLGTSERLSPDRHYVILGFLAATTNPEPLRAGDDAAQAAWVALEEVPEVELVDGMLDFLVRHGVVAKPRSS